jgi:hypothetical protein
VSPTTKELRMSAPPFRVMHSISSDIGSGDGDEDGLPLKQQQPSLSEPKHCRRCGTGLGPGTVTTRFGDQPTYEAYVSYFTDERISRKTATLNLERIPRSKGRHAHYAHACVRHQGEKHNEAKRH